MVARRAHNPKVVGSNPAPATREKAVAIATAYFFLLNSAKDFQTQEFFHVIQKRIFQEQT